jgi:hypothetical protein
LKGARRINKSIMTTTINSTSIITSTIGVDNIRNTTDADQSPYTYNIPSGNEISGTLSPGNFVTAMFFGGYKYKSGQGVFIGYNNAGTSQWPVDIQIYSKNITMYKNDDVTNPSTWKHTYTGVYMAAVSHRYQSGDVWQMLSVTKDGSSEAAGISGRTGAYAAGGMYYREVMYLVDSTTSVYQLTGWAQGADLSVGVSNTDTSTADGGPINPPWTYVSLFEEDPTGGGATDPGGLCYSLYIHRVSEL